MRAVKLAAVLILASGLGACGTLASGPTQTVTVETEPDGSRCELQNDKGSWYIESTPGTVAIHRSYSDLGVRCLGAFGNSGSRVVSSRVRLLSYGSLVAAGAPGFLTDLATDSAYSYPSTVRVPLESTAGVRPPPPVGQNVR